MLPVIDISNLSSDDINERRHVARALGEAYGEAGFAYIAEHGIPQAVQDNALDAMRAYFARPEGEKRLLTRREGVYRGYVPVMPFGRNASGAPPALYEAFLMGADPHPDDPEVHATNGLYGPNVWPEEPAGFRQTMTAYWNAVSALSDNLLRGFALFLEQDETVLVDKFRKPLSNISFLYYPSRPNSEGHPPDDMNAHRDTNAITVLLPSQVGGLEVATADGGWMEAPPKPGCFVVNIGNMMECWSGGRLKSTYHRVHPPRDKERYSIGFFAVPDHDTVVEPLPGLPVTGTPEDMAPRHAGKDLAAFVEKFDADVPRAKTGAA